MAEPPGTGRCATWPSPHVHVPQEICLPLWAACVSLVLDDARL